MRLPDKRIRPASNGPDSESRTATKPIDCPHSSDLVARARRHDHGVLVLAERQDGVVVSQVFADLPAAERKVQRTRERGLSATLTLVRLVPLPHVAPDALEALGGGR